MEEPNFQPNFDDPRWGEVFSSFPIVERWLALVRELLGHGGADERTGTEEAHAGASSLVQMLRECASNSVETAVAPSVIRNPERLPIEVLPTDIDERLRLQSLFEQYETCRERLTPGQWRAVCLRFRDRLTEGEVALVLEKSRSAVHGLLKRARLRKEAYGRERREEGFHLARKHLNK